MTEAQREQRETALGRSTALCPVCGRPLESGAPQFAHKIANTLEYRKKYGSFIIDNAVNGEYVCCLGCNSSVSVGKSRGAHLDVITDCVIAEYVKLWGVQGMEKLIAKLLAKLDRMGIK